MTVTTGTNPKNRGFIREKSLKKTHKEQDYNYRIQLVASNCSS